jgi:hypothetical protein
MLRVRFQAIRHRGPQLQFDAELVIAAHGPLNRAAAKLTNAFNRSAMTRTMGVNRRGRGLATSASNHRKAQTGQQQAGSARDDVVIPTVREQPFALSVGAAKAVVLTFGYDRPSQLIFSYSAY